MGIEATVADQIIDASTVGKNALKAVDAAAFRTVIELGTLATQNGTISDYLTIASAASTYLQLSGGTLTNTLTVSSGNIVAGGLTINPSNGSVTFGQTFAMVLQTANTMVLRHGNNDLTYTRPVSATSGTYSPAGYGAFGFANNANAIGVYLVPTEAGILEVRDSTHGTAAITASSFNKITVTAPATSATLTLADGCSLITSGANSLTITTTGTTNATLPSGTSTIVARDSTDTLTNKRIQRRIVSTSSASSLTPDISTADFYEYTALAAGLTISNPTGTPVNGELLNFRFQDNGVQRSIAWGAYFRSMSATLPSATVANKVIRVLAEWNATDLTWDCLAVSTEP